MSKKIYRPRKLVPFVHIQYKFYTILTNDISDLKNNINKKLINKEINSVLLANKIDEETMIKFSASSHDVGN